MTLHRSSKASQLFGMIFFPLDYWLNSQTVCTMHTNPKFASHFFNCTLNFDPLGLRIASSCCSTSKALIWIFQSSLLDFEHEGLLNMAIPPIIPEPCRPALTSENVMVREITNLPRLHQLHKLRGRCLNYHTLEKEVKFQFIQQYSYIIII